MNDVLSSHIILLENKTNLKKEFSSSTVRNNTMSIGKSHVFTFLNFSELRKNNKNETLCMCETKQI